MVLLPAPSVGIERQASKRQSRRTAASTLHPTTLAAAYTAHSKPPVPLSLVSRATTKALVDHSQQGYRCNIGAKRAWTEGDHLKAVRCEQLQLFWLRPAPLRTDGDNDPRPRRCVREHLADAGRTSGAWHRRRAGAVCTARKLGPKRHDALWVASEAHGSNGLPS